MKLLVWSKRIAFGVLSLFVVLLIVVLLSVPLSYINSPNLKVTPTSQSSYILNNIQIVDISGNRIISDKSLLIEEGKIQAIDTLSNLIKPDIQVIDGNKRYLTPGLVDAHVHVFDPQDLGLYLSHGITSVRNMSGLPAHLSWKQAQSNNEFMGSRLITTSPALNAGNDIGPFHERVESPEHGRQLVQKFKQQGFDAIKVYSGLDKAMLNAIMEEALKLGLPVTGHPSAHVKFGELLAMPYQSLEHVEELFQIPMNHKHDDNVLNTISQAIVDNNKTIVTTLVAYHNIYLASEENIAFKQRINWDYLTPFTAFVGDKQLSDYWQVQDNSCEVKKMATLNSITKSLFSKGAKMAIGTDTGPALTMPGLSYHDELSLLVKMGIGNQKILLAATKNAAELLNISDVTGTITPGTKADLLLVDENPLKNIATLRYPYAVIANGHYLNQQQIYSLQKQGKQHHSFYTVMGWLLNHFF